MIIRPTKMKKTPLAQIGSLLIVLVLIPMISSTTLCDTSKVQQTWEQGTAPDPVSLTCTNQDNSTTVSMTQAGSYYFLNPSLPFNLQPLTPHTFDVSFDSNAPVGALVGLINFDDGSDTILIEMTVEEGAPQGCIIDIFPTVLTNVKVQQGESKTRNIQLSVPSCYPSPVNVNGVSLQTDEKPIQLGEISIGTIQPGSSILVPMEINAVDVLTGHYSDTLQFLIYDDRGDRINVPSVSISVSVTQGISPADDTTFSTPPSCSLSSTTLNLNNTYSFTCSGVVSNLDVSPDVNEYYIGKTVDVSSGLYVYEFSPVKFGNTYFTANFKFRESPIFAPFSEELRITSSGSVAPGTNLRLKFTPSLSEANDGETVLIQVEDNKSDSLVPDPRLWVDAKELEINGLSFEYEFETGRSYEMRAKAPGYDDLIEDIEVNPQVIDITINPATGNTNTLFNITTSAENASLFINGVKVNNPYYAPLSSGSNEIKAIKQGFQDKTINFTVDGFVRVLSGGDDFKKGSKQAITLSQVANYSVYYQSDPNSIERELYISGLGSLVEFTPEEKGYYILEADGRTIQNYEAKGINWSAKWLWLPWYVWGLIILVIGIFIIYKVASRGGAQEDGGAYFSPGGGQQGTGGD